MPLLAAIVGLLAGWALWVVVDAIQTGAVRRIYEEQLNRILEQSAREELLHFNHSVESYDTTVRLLANHRRLANYLDPVYWFPDDFSDPIVYREKPPVWLPEPERWQPLVSPSHILLLDTSGQVREEYVVEGEPLSEELLQQAPGFTTHTRAFLTAFDDEPYLLTSTVAEDAGYNIMGSLMMVVPIDDDFLEAAQRVVSADGTITAVVDLDEQLILSSSATELLPPGTPVSNAEKTYAVTFQSFFDYEGTNLNLQFATFVPRAGVYDMSRRIVKLERRQRLILALSFVAFFTLLFMVVSNRLSRSLKRLSGFSQRALGISQPVDETGNQLFILEDWMKRFIQLVKEARDETRVRHESEIREKEALTTAIMRASVDSIVTVVVPTASMPRLYLSGVSNVAVWLSPDVTLRFNTDASTAVKFTTSVSVACA